MKYDNTRNLCSAFDPSKVHTHPEQWAAFVYAAASGEQLGIRCLAQGLKIMLIKLYIYLIKKIQKKNNYIEQKKSKKKKKSK